MKVYFVWSFKLSKISHIWIFAPKKRFFEWFWHENSNETFLMDFDYSTYSFSSSIDDRVSLDFSSVSLFFRASVKLPVDWDNVKELLLPELLVKDFSSKRVSKLRRIQLGVVVDSFWNLEEVEFGISIKKIWIWIFTWQKSSEFLSQKIIILKKWKKNQNLNFRAKSFNSNFVKCDNYLQFLKLINLNFRAKSFNLQKFKWDFWIKGVNLNFCAKKIGLNFRSKKF